MPATITKIIDPDNGAGTDYTSLSAWEAAMQKNLVTADEISEAKCRCTAGTADTYCQISGWTTDATRYIRVYTDSAESYRPEGKWQTGNKYRMTRTDNTVLDIREEYVRVEGIQAEITATTGSPQCGLVFSLGASSDVRFDKDIFRRSPSSSGGNVFGVKVNSATSNVTFKNCVMDNCNYAGIEFSSGTTGRMYNCTVVNSAGSTYGIRRYASPTPADVTLKNCIVQAASATCYDGSFNAASDYNVAQCASAPGTHSWQSRTLILRDKAGYDYHLDPSDSPAIGKGVGSAVDANIPLDDFDGDTRNVNTPDIGMDEILEPAHVRDLFPVAGII